MKQQQPTAPSDVDISGFDEFVNEYPAPEYGRPDELIRRLPELYVISDSHFFHHNIIRMQDRPWNVDELMMERCHPDGSPSQASVRRRTGAEGRLIGLPESAVTKVFVSPRP